MVILDVPLLLENRLNLKSDVLIFVNSKKIYNRLKRRKILIKDCLIVYEIIKQFCLKKENC